MLNESESENLREVLCDSIAGLHNGNITDFSMALSPGTLTLVIKHTSNLKAVKPPADIQAAKS